MNLEGSQSFLLILAIHACRLLEVNFAIASSSVGPGELGTLKKETLSRPPRLWQPTTQHVSTTISIIEALTCPPALHAS